VIWTHDHADHCHGLDDLRQLYHARGRPVDGYARPQTLASLQDRFAYAFNGRDGYPPTVSAHDLPDDWTLGSIRIRTVDQPHGSITSAGLRFESSDRSISYSTDFNELTPDMAKLFEDSDIWVVDALRYRPHPTHPHLAQTLQWAEQLNVAHAILTHMDQSMDYATLSATLPAGVEAGWDGLEAEIA
jgi:phosphoribosyl 1,2-cyclic phosphate phosphodiesterase